MIEPPPLAVVALGIALSFAGIAFAMANRLGVAVVLTAASGALLLAVAFA